jgi:hypothetical protein
MLGVARAEIPPPDAPDRLIHTREAGSLSDLVTRIRSVLQQSMLGKGGAQGNVPTRDVGLPEWPEVINITLQSKCALDPTIEKEHVCVSYSTVPLRA